MRIYPRLAGEATKIKIKIDFSLNDLNKILSKERLNCLQFTPNLLRNVDAIILILILTSC